MRNGSDKNKSRDRLGTMDRTREKDGHEAARSAWDLAASHSWADEAAADHAPRSKKGSTPVRCGLQPRSSLHSFCPPLISLVWWVLPLSSGRGLGVWWQPNTPEPAAVMRDRAINGGGAMLTVF